MVIGKGSNLLVSDRGFQGVVVRLRGGLAEVSTDEGGGTLSAGGGAANRRVLDRCTSEGLGGLEFLAGIPGTAGGAVATNAGASGRDTGAVLREVELLNEAGETETVPAGAMAFSYRSSGLPRGAVVTRVRFEVRREEPGTVKARIDRNLEGRRRSQPLRFPSAGSVFRNPPEAPAWRLVDEAGLRGKRIGGAEISPIHANFIVNLGGATAEDVLSLVDLAREAVLQRTGIELEPEIRTVGF
jgi:UDP-N-acetylmuramate dehydrogenase